MIEKHFRKYEPMIYRRRYKCPKCGSYSLWIPMDNVCECSNCELDLSDELIDKVIVQGDFEGYFEKNELDEQFFFSLKSLDDILEANGMLQSEPFSINKKVNDKIDILYKKTGEIDNLLDDLVSEYNNRYQRKDRDGKFNEFNYLIAIIEEVNLFLNLVCKDINLYDASVSKKLPFAELNYSGAFYANNAIDHLFQANERMYVVLGIMMGYPFKDDFSQNTTGYIAKYIKKQNLYIQNYKKFFDMLTSNNSYRSLKEMRNYNEHDLTYIEKKVIEEKVDVSMDRETIDKNFFDPLLKDYIFCIDKLYEILFQIIKDVEQMNLFSFNPIPMCDKYLKDDIYIPKLNQYNYKFYEKIERYRLKLEESILCFGGNIRITDVYFRLDEICHCIRDIYNKNVTTIDINGFEDFVDKDYIVYSALIRVYSCYDKIAKYLSCIYSEYRNVKYFDDLFKLTSNRTIYRNINEIRNNDNYKLLCIIRNMIYHNIRYGSIFGKKSQEYYLNCCIQIILENTYMLYVLLEKIKPGNKIIKMVGQRNEIRIDVERNTPCPCGSGKKYKKCCLNKGTIFFNGINSIK